MIFSHNFPLGSEDITHASEDWTDIMDRGGLKHVTDMVYMLFVSMEMELRHHLHPAKMNESSDLKAMATKSIIENEDVTFYWSILALNWEENEAGALLQMIVEHWITIRGFSFTSGFMEKYKCKNKKSVQKSKGLRKNLLGASTTITDKT